MTTMNETVAAHTTPAEQEAVKALRAVATTPQGDDALLAAFSAELYKHAQALNEEVCGGKLPDFAVGIGQTDHRVLGFFRPGRNDLGLRRTITMNLVHLQGQPAWHTLSTLLHEMAHLYQHLYGTPGLVKRHHHNAEYRALVSSWGIPCDEGGTDAMPPTEDGPFHEYCKRRNIPWGNKKGALGPEAANPILPPLPAGPKAKRPQMALWTCGCTKVRASAGVDVVAKCGKCGRDFARQDKKE